MKRTEHEKRTARRMVHEGYSLRYTSRFLDIPLTTIASWCSGIVKAYPKVEKKKSDEDIIACIRQHRVMTGRQLEDKMGYEPNGIRRRILGLLAQQKIFSFYLSMRGHHYMKTYTDCRLLYCNAEDVDAWIQEQTSPDLTRYERKSLTTLVRHAP